MGTSEGSGDWLLVQELFERGDPSFVDELRKIDDADALGAFAPRWLADKRPEARRLLLDYLDRPAERLSGTRRWSSGCSSSPRGRATTSSWAGSSSRSTARSAASQARRSALREPGRRDRGGGQRPGRGVAGPGVRVGQRLAELAEDVSRLGPLDRADPGHPARDRDAARDAEGDASTRNSWNPRTRPLHDVLRPRLGLRAQAQPAELPRGRPDSPRRSATAPGAPALLGRHPELPPPPRLALFPQARPRHPDRYVAAVTRPWSGIATTTSPTGWP